MKKLLTILLFMGIIFYGNSQERPIFEVTSSFPKALSPEKDYTFTITIKKPAIQPFAVYEQEFPQNFSVTANDVGKGILQIEDNKVTISWIRLPKDKIVTIKLNLKPKNRNFGRFSSAGTLSYIYQDKKGVVSSNIINFDVVAGGTYQSTKTVETTTPSSKTTTTKSSQNISSTTTTYSTYSSKTTPPQDLPSCYRTITRTNTGYHVTLNFYKINQMGATRIVETIPYGYQLQTPLPEYNANVKTENNQVILIWDNISQAGINTIEYEVNANANQASPKINGLIAFSNNGELKRQKIKTKDKQ